ncbi:MAG TPA: diacylglycerol kinase, partial [Steroidobacteraceae bacterium]|nr:diacylglycerol kinase [Steroidobacteraceae bacterium]
MATLMQDRQKPTGLKRLLLATGHSWRGLVGAFREEAAFRQELALTVVLLPLGIWLGRTGVERALLIGSLLLVLIVELLNSGIEAVVDRVGLERHELSGLAKDMGSAAVLVSLLNV